jgi:3-deoxy-D-manno-octulosonate 8-phosphate phosphatase (KDO 8-P phosphatase)
MSLDQADFRERCLRLSWLVCDVDGVLCERLWYDGEGESVKPFDVKDGFALRAAASVGFGLALLSARSSAPLERRARDLGFDAVMSGSRDKGASLYAFLEERQLSAEQVAYVGDDLTDLPPILVAGVSFAPADAAVEVRERVDVVLETPGGRGAVREMIERILRARGDWETVVARYLPS